MPLLKKRKKVSDVGKGKKTEPKKVSKQKSKVPQKKHHAKNHERLKKHPKPAAQPSKSKTSQSSLKSKSTTVNANAPKQIAPSASKHKLKKHKHSATKKQDEDNNRHHQAPKKKEKHHEKSQQKSNSQPQSLSQLQSQTSQSQPPEKKDKVRAKRDAIAEKPKTKHDNERAKRKENEKSKQRQGDHVDLSLPSDSSQIVKKQKSEVSDKLQKPAKFIQDPPKIMGAASTTFNLNEVLRIGGVLGRYGMDKKRREAFDWLASHPLEAADGTPEAVYNVRVAVGDLPMSKLLVSEVLRLLVKKGEITPEEYQRYFFTLEQNVTDQAITISQFAYFVNTHCEKYKYRPIMTYNNK